MLFHSMLGLRDLERDAAARLCEAGYDVVLPDLKGWLGRYREEPMILTTRIPALDELHWIPRLLSNEAGRHGGV